MSRLCLLMLMLIVITLGCKNDDGTVEEDLNVFNFERFSLRFKESKVPYQVSDTGLINNKDTAVIRNKAFLAYIPDSLNTILFGKDAKPRYIPLVSLPAGERGTYFVLKGLSGNKRAALLTIFNQDGNFVGAFPLLVPDRDSKTSQWSTIDKSYSITRALSRRNNDGALNEGKEVYAFDNSSNSFSLVMTDLPNSNVELINPIDTFSRQHKYAADYVKDKKNIVSVRDGRNEKEINFFIHFEKNNGDCIGELKGTAFFVTSKKAVFRPSGDPCILELNFTSSSVTLKEEGCGYHRGVQCLFEGNYPKKKVAKAKTTTAKKSS